MVCLKEVFMSAARMSVNPITYILYVVERYSHTIENSSVRGRKQRLQQLVLEHREKGK